MSPMSDDVKRLKATVERVVPTLDESPTKVLTDEELDAVRKSFVDNVRAKELVERHGKSGLLKILDACSRKVNKLST